MSVPDALKNLVEIRAGFQSRPGISHVLFDFDGTLSLIREGWPEVMVPLFVEKLPRQAGDTEDSLRAMVYDDIMRLNGKQTIYQMIQLADRIRERGGEPDDPLEYKHEYLGRLEQRIAGRKEGLRSGALDRESLVVHQARQLLQGLQDRGLTLYLASGTDGVYVREEAALLGLESFFGSHIYGARDDYQSFSKQKVIERLLADHQVAGEQLLAFGDGYVEIQNTKEAGGLAVAVASDEAHNGSGNVDAWKRDRLWGVGADMVIPDFREAESLLQLILGPA